MKNIIRLLLLSTLLVTVANCAILPIPSRSFTPTPGTIEPSSSSGIVPDSANSLPQHTPMIKKEGQQATPLSSEGATPTSEPVSDSIDKNISLVNQIGGRNLDIETEGGYAYMGVGPRLMTFNISDPTNPLVMGQTAVLRGVVQDLTIQSNMAYIVTPYSLYIIDISNPTRPVQIGSYEYNENFQARHISVVEGIAYITSRDEGLLIIDTSDPTNPKELSIFADSLADIQVVDNLIYLADEGLRILDISNPSQPTEISFYQTSERPEQIIVEGDVAYINAFQELLILDISDPATPKEVSNFKVDNPIFDISINNGVIYLIENGRQLHILDNPSPKELHEISTYELPNQTWSLTVEKVSSDSKVYAYLGWGGLGIIDVSQPDKPKEIGNIDLLGDANDVAVIQNDSLDQKVTEFLLVTCKTGLCLVDISDLAAPFLAGFYSVSSNNTSNIKVVGDLGFVQVEPFTEEKKSLIILDISKPNTPQKIGSYPYPGQLEVMQQKAYIAAGRDGLHILDISNPSAPQLLGTYQSENWMWDIAVSGQTAYITDDNLQVIDISNPTDPKLISSYQAPDPVTFDAVMLIQDTIYTTGFRGATHIINATNPSHLKEVAFLDDLTNWGPNSAQIANTAYLYSLGSLNILNTSNPSQPNIIDSYELFVQTASIAVEQEKIYVAAGDSGIFILSANN